MQCLKAEVFKTMEEKAESFQMAQMAYILLLCSAELSCLEVNSKAIILKCGAPPST